MAQLPPLNRSRIQADLDLFSHRVAEELDTRMPGYLRAGLAMAGLDLGRRISSASSALTALSDEDLTALIDAAAQELGAWRGVRDPVTLTPELQGALARFLAQVGG